MAEVAQPEAAGSNRRVQAVVGIVILIVAYLIVKSVIKKNYIGGLASPDAAVRTRSAQWLMDSKILTDTLSRQTVPVKRPVVKTLEAMNTDATAGELVALMKDRNPTVQNEAQFALQRMSPTSMQKLVDGLKNADMNIKSRSALALIAIGRPVLNPVKKKVKDADGNETEVDAVPIVEATADAASRTGVIRVLSAIRVGATPWLMQKMAAEKSDAATKACCIEILGRIGAQEAAAPIREMLNAEKVDPAVQKAVLVALGRLRHPDAFGLLKAALEDPKSDSGMKNTAIVGFGELRDPRAVGPVRDYLFGYDEALRDAAVAAFSKIGPPAIPALSELMKNPHYEVRMGALRSLAGIQDPRVVSILTAALKDGDVNVRVTAADVLGRPGDATAVAPLLAALSDPSWRVAAKARDSLAVVGPPAVPGLAVALGKGEASLASFYAQGALERVGEAAVPTLVAVVRGSNPGATQRAVVALGNIGDRQALVVLSNLAASGSPAVRGAAAQAVKQIEEGRRAG